MKRKVGVVCTLKQARTYVLQVGICGDFFRAHGLVCRTYGMWSTCLTGSPDKTAGVRKMLAIWRWKNELPAIYPGRDLLWKDFRPVTPH